MYITQQLYGEVYEAKIIQAYYLDRYEYFRELNYSPKSSKQWAEQIVVNKYGQTTVDNALGILN